MNDTASRLSLLGQDFGTLPDLVRSHARARPSAPALLHRGQSLDYAGLDRMMDRVALGLQRHGLASGGAVAVCAAASIAYACVFLGALRAGAAVAPLAPSSSPEALGAMIADCGAAFLFCDAETERALAPLRGKIGARLIRLDSAEFETWLPEAGAAPAPAAIAPDDAFNIIYSSGTTGAPKGIVQSHAMRWGHMTRAAVFGYAETSVTLVSTPLYSTTTLVSFFPALAQGGAVVLMEKFDAAGFLALAQTHGVTHAMLVPVQYRRIMDVPDFGKYDLSRFVMKFSTSAPFSAALKTDILARWPGGLVEYYGMTEGGGTCILAAHMHPAKLHTVGQPAEGHDIRLIDEAGRELPRGKMGEIVGHSGAMMNFYLNQPGKTREAEWFDASGKRFIRTGDIGRFDEDGFLVLMDRAKDMIISGGFNIYPSDIEAVILRQPGIAEAAVVGVASRRWGETPVAFVVADAGAAADAAALRSAVNAQLGKIQRIALVEIVAVLPRSAIGKVLKRELRDGFRGNVD